MAVELGTRVVRGTDWKWENQDGGEGCAGTVVRLGQGDEKSPSKEQLVWIQWDCGTKANYRAGIDGKHDLRVLDSANEGVRHVHVLCDGCGQEPVVGLRWHCLGCPNFDLCTTCYMTDKHNLHHSFERIDKSRGKGTAVGGRYGSIKLEVRGIFKGAKVVRGEDWKYKDQDGGSGMEGLVTEITGWDDESKKDAARVSWEQGQRENIYRVGKQGKVDLKCTVPAVGGSYYRDHLPHLSVNVEKTKSGFTTGDKVYVHVTTERLKQLSADHGGWHDNMEKFLGKVGVVHDFTSSGDVLVEYPDRRWRYNPEALTKVPHFKRGDEVLIKSDRSLVEELQQGHGGWNEAMISILGRTGKVLEVDGNGDLVTSVEGDKWMLNPAAVTYVTEPETGESMGSSAASGGSSFDGGDLLQRLLSDLLSQAAGANGGSSNDLVDACRRNRLSRVREILDSNPEKIDEMDGGHTPLQVACHEGHCDVVRLLLDRGASQHAIDTQGYVAMHHAAYGDRSGEALTLMLERGLNPNARNLENGSTPLHLAVKRSNVVGVRILSQFPACDVNTQDEAGDTPLYDAITEKKNIMVDLIMAHPRLSMTVTNRGGFNYLHHAVLKGNTHAVEKLLQRAGDVLNVPKTDGFTSLHIAAINDHRDEAILLFQQPGSLIDARSSKKQTPLHLAATEGYAAMVELLLDHGADANAEDEDGDTALHIALAKESMFSSGPDMPSLQLLLGLQTGQGDSQSYANVSRFLLNYGANVHHFNGRGETPMDKCSGSGVQTLIRDIATVGGIRADKSPTFATVRRTQDGPNTFNTAPSEASSNRTFEGRGQDANIMNDFDAQGSERRSNEQSEDISEQSQTGPMTSEQGQANADVLQTGVVGDSEENPQQENTAGGTNTQSDPNASSHVDRDEEFSNLENVPNGVSQETSFVNDFRDDSGNVKENIVVEVTNQVMSPTDDQSDDYKNQETPAAAQPERSNQNDHERNDELFEIQQPIPMEDASSATTEANVFVIVSEEEPQVVCADEEQRGTEEPVKDDVNDQEEVQQANEQEEASDLVGQSDTRRSGISYENGTEEPIKSEEDVCEEVPKEKTQYEVASGLDVNTEERQSEVCEESRTAEPIKSEEDVCEEVPKERKPHEEASSLDVQTDEQQSEVCEEGRTEEPIKSEEAVQREVPKERTQHEAASGLDVQNDERQCEVCEESRTEEPIKSEEAVQREVPKERKPHEEASDLDVQTDERQSEVCKESRTEEPIKSEEAVQREVPRERTQHEAASCLDVESLERQSGISEESKPGEPIKSEEVVVEEVPVERKQHEAASCLDVERLERQGGISEESKTEEPIKSEEAVVEEVPIERMPQEGARALDVGTDEPPSVTSEENRTEEPVRSEGDVCKEVPKERKQEEKGAALHVQSDVRQSRVFQESKAEKPVKNEATVRKEVLIETRKQEKRQALHLQTDGGKCRICEDNEADVVFKPCGHNFVCAECTSRMKRCLECGATITARGRRDGEPISGLNDKSMTVLYQLLEGKVRKMEESIVCCICVERKKNIIFLCGHGTCQKCADQLKVCPICQKRIDKKVTVF